MSLNPVRPSPAITVRSDTSIGEVIRIMKERRVGSVLIIEASHPFRLVGIFTERDVVRWVMDVNASNAWDKPIATIMTKNLVKVHVSDLEKAPEIMIEHNIRHLPVVFKDEQKVEHLAGVLSMRDLLRRFVRGGEPTKELTKKITPQGKAGESITKIVFISNDPATHKSIDMLIKQSPGYVLQPVDLDQLIKAFDSDTKLPDFDLLVFDIDFCKTDKWPFIMRELLKKEKDLKILALFSPLLQQENTQNSLAVLSKSPNFAAFAKPINLLDFYKRLRVWKANR